MKKLTEIKKLYLEGYHISAMNYLKNEIYLEEISKILNKSLPLTKIDKNMYKYMFIYDIYKIPICKYCNINNSIFVNNNTGFINRCGCTECIKQHRSDAIKKGWNKKDKNKIVKKTQETNIKRFGAVSNLSKNTTARDYAMNKLYDKYKVYHPSKSKEIMKKKMDTFNDRYGGLDIVNNPKTKKTIYEKYNVEYAGSSIELSKRGGFTQSNKKFKELIKKSDIIDISDITYMYNDNKYWLKCKCNKCNTYIDNIHRVTLNRAIITKSTICVKCNPDITKYRSNSEREITEFLRTITDADILNNNRKLFNTEVDIIIPKLKIGIEFNGLYWHSEFRKGQNYHINKHNILNNKNYTLIMIWEDDWNNKIKKEIIKSRLTYLLNKIKTKIYARNTYIKEISYKDASKFLNENHLYGYTNSSIKLGIYQHDKLLSVATFGRPRTFISGKNNNYSYELYRFAVLKNTIIVGGFSKLLTYFDKHYMKKNETILSYVDRDWTNNKENTYSISKFEFEKFTTPGYWWVINGLRHNRFNFTRSKIKDINVNETVNEYMENKGAYKVESSGNLKFVYTKGMLSNKNI